MLKNLLSIPGADPHLVTVFIDGYFDVSIQCIYIHTYYKLMI